MKHSSQINFLTIFYVLNAGLSQDEVCWAWENIINREQINNWYTFYYDLTGSIFIINSIMCLWLFFSFIAALFPHFHVFRMGTFLSFFGAMVLLGKADDSLFTFLLEIFPLCIFGLMPNSFLFSKKNFNKINNLLNSKRVFIQFFLLFFLLLIVWHSFQYYFLYKQIFFLLLSFFIIIQSNQSVLQRL